MTECRPLKKVSYFSHDSNARNDDKVLNLRMALGAEGYGIYFMILERLREETNYMGAKDYNAIAFDLRVDASKVKKVVEEFGLFEFTETEKGEYFYSESFSRRMSIKDQESKKKSQAGKLGALKRWGNNNGKDDTNDSTAINNNSNANSNATKNYSKKERKEESKESKESKERDKEKRDKPAEPPSPSKTIITSKQIDELIALWNSLDLPSNVASIKNTRLTQLKARIKEYSYEQVLEAIHSIGQSPFLLGQNDRGWAITIDWFLKPNNFPKVLEGNYLDKGRDSPHEATRGLNRPKGSGEDFVLKPGQTKEMFGSWF